ncbi:MAG TPA: hypothetical protein VGQ99_21985 [Tepidisphaeraceae bacterium]|jgi:hypothetical protein|nr:hypothetical protein [Tepidisphaeraceae bacterium]
MPLQDSEFARRDAGRLELRKSPMRLRWIMEKLVSGDGHELRAEFCCSLKVLPEPAEQQMLAEVFLNDGNSIWAEAVIAHFQPALRAAIAQVCGVRPAVQSVGTNVHDLTEALRTAAQRVAFSCGLELLPPFDLDVQSPSLEHQRLEAMQRSLAEQRAAGQMEHFQRATDLLKQFESIRQAAPQLSPGEVLRQLGPADQGTMLQTLLLAAAREKTSESVWAVAGPNLLRVDPRSSPPKTQMIPLSTTLGPLRSVQRSGIEKRLLVGARSGLFDLDPTQPSPDAYTDQSVVSQLGFNQALIWNNQLWASHTEAGIVAWKIGQPDRPVLAMRPVNLLGTGAKNLAILDDSRLLFSGGNRLMLLQREDSAQDPKITAKAAGPDVRAEIIAVLPDAARVIVVLKDGNVQTRDRGSLEVISQERRCGAVSSAALLPWLGSTRLLLGTEEGPVLCVGLEDELVTQYVSPYAGMKALSAAADVVVALSADRQRLVLWNTWSGRQPAADLFVTALVKHRAADVAVG